MERVGPRRLEAMGEKILALQERTRFLEGELLATRATLQQARWRITTLEQQLVEEKSHAATLLARISEMQIQEVPPAVPAKPEAPTPQIPFKANVSTDNKRPPGRPPGHEAAHRPAPRSIDTHVTVPLPRDRAGKASCPACHCQLQQVKKHRRIVEDIVPARRIVTCYHTTSGYCPGCRKQVESREKNQPPAPAGVKLQQSQLGLNSLAIAALLRIRYRLPFRQIQQLFLDLPGLSIGASGVARQMQRMAGWLKGQYDRLKVLIRAGPFVHMDETGWRIDGQNHWLWTMLSGKATLYHIDKSRGQKVPAALLGEHFGGTLISDFYSAYAKLDCPKQKCLAHLLRELKNTREKHPDFARGPFAGRLRRLLAQMLLLKPKKRQLGRVAYQSRGRKLERRLLELGRGPEGGWKEPQAQRLARRLRGHEGELTAFLSSKDVEPTNNAAERALRPAVVMRKITGGSRSQAGAQATAVLMTILRTAMQQGCPLFETIKALLTAHWAGENPALLTDLFKNSA
jgi:transposase